MQDEHTKPETRTDVGGRLERIVRCDGHATCSHQCAHKTPHNILHDEYTDSDTVYGCDEIATFCIISHKDQRCVSI